MSLLNSMRFSTNLYEEINEALKSIYLSQDEFEELSNEMSIAYWQDNEELYNLSVDSSRCSNRTRLENIVITEQEDSMNNAMIELTSQLLRDHIEELMKGDWEKVRDEVALCHGALYELHGQRID